MPQPIILCGDTQRNHAKAMIDKAPKDAVVTISEKAQARTTAQNALLHRWFADISRHHSFGQTEADVKAECNLTYGRPILARDNSDWNDAFGYIFDALSKPAKLKAIRVLDIPFTRGMKVKQLTEYMDEMRRDYAELGVQLTDPEARKYEAAQ